MRPGFPANPAIAPRSAAITTRPTAWRDSSGRFFGELCAGDPATDLAAAWLLLPADAASRFFDTYAHVDEAMIRRARGWAVLRSLSLIGIGQAWERELPGGQPTWGRAGQAALERVLASSERG